MKDEDVGGQRKLQCTEPQIKKKEQLGEEIEDVITSTPHFFIGIGKMTKENASALDALYECELRTRDQKKVLSRPNHPADKKAKDKNLQLVKTFHTLPLTVKSALETYGTLISNYSQHSLCINDNPECPKLETEKAIVYIRIYGRIPV